MTLTRKKVIDRIPFSFGIIQRIADDLKVTRAAVSQFIHKPGNEDILELLALEKSRIYDYAELNIFDQIICKDLETTKWYMATFPNRADSPPQKKYPVNYRNRLRNDKEQIIYSKGNWEYASIRGLNHKQLDVQDAYLEGANTTALPAPDVEQLKLNPPQPEEYKTYGREVVVKNVNSKDKQIS